jgi:uncharacterized protein (TIGR01244 family)
LTYLADATHKPRYKSSLDIYRVLKHMVRFIIITILLFMQVFSYAQVTKGDCWSIESELKSDITRITCINDKIALSGQLSASAYKKLADKGFKVVINLRTDKEGVDIAAEKKLAEEAGLKNILVPVDGNNPQNSSADEFIKVVRNEQNNPILICCGSGNRAAAMWMIYRVVEEGKNEQDALIEAQKAGLKSEVMKKFVDNYIKEHKNTK